jgi:hypothetical protein
MIMIRLYVFSVLISFALGSIANMLHTHKINGVTFDKKEYRKISLMNIKAIYFFPVLNIIGALILLVVAIMKRVSPDKIDKVIGEGVKRIVK